ncbi:REP-associated tyrosine transposase [Botrimarina mediterranea]|uniref:Transposase IS200-like domain-containing protein n=1 Tax=Botrimarina mediterranea TaxID=2528022 RepID=A0A518K3Y6_9BACT|nr:transposase [Botrimarina mediterranea]QDV72496.1 hypothetical protein Spa11_06740 [Botrimarina mediterranea]QDV77068.1 hypothetical protein K2D_06550 [Planctomycetes bacterium K2D]
MPPNRKTCRRYDVPGDAHFLTFSCYRRLALLDRDRSRQWFIDAVRLGQQKALFDLWAYVIMPEHVHLIVLPLGPAKMASILTVLKQSTSSRALVWLKNNSPDYLPNLLDRQPNGKASYRFWQRGGGYDRNLRSVRDIHEKIAYIHDNPVRRGLVAKPSDWRWSSAAAWNTGIDLPLGIDRDRVPTLTLLDDAVDGACWRRNS